jgi:hypothetical protein
VGAASWRDEHFESDHNAGIGLKKVELFFEA